MKIYSHPGYDIDLGVLNLLHPFDGRKYSRIIEALRSVDGIEFASPEAPIDDEQINSYVNPLLARLLTGKRFVLQALELPYLPLLPFSAIERRLLIPMRWAVAGTCVATMDALNGRSSWNLAGGYHHASPDSAEGFCLYNDIGIAIQQARQLGRLSDSERILIIDVDAHHGNGNARAFMDCPNITILDVYNKDIYPQSEFTRQRVDVPVSLAKSTAGVDYLSALDTALAKLTGRFRLAFVIAGTDVLSCDRLGGLQLSIADVIQRDAAILNVLRSLSVPAVVLGGGGYSRESVKAVCASITTNFRSLT